VSVVHVSLAGHQTPIWVLVQFLGEDFSGIQNILRPRNLDERAPENNSDRISFKAESNLFQTWLIFSPKATLS